MEAAAFGAPSLVNGGDTVGATGLLEAEGMIGGEGPGVVGGEGPGESSPVERSQVEATERVADGDAPSQAVAWESGTGGAGTGGAGAGGAHQSAAAGCLQVEDLT